MEFKDKYKRKGEIDPNKIELDNNSYAIGELLQMLIKQLSRFK